MSILLRFPDHGHDHESRSQHRLFFWQQDFSELRYNLGLNVIELPQLLGDRGSVDDFDIQLRLVGFRQQLGVLQGTHKRSLQEFKPVFRSSPAERYTETAHRGRCRRL